MTWKTLIYSVRTRDEIISATILIKAYLHTYKGKKLKEQGNRHYSKNSPLEQIIKKIFRRVREE